MVLSGLYVRVVSMLMGILRRDVAGSSPGRYALAVPYSSCGAVAEGAEGQGHRLAFIAVVANFGHGFQCKAVFGVLSEFGKQVGVVEDYDVVEQHLDIGRTELFGGVYRIFYRSARRGDIAYRCAKAQSGSRYRLLVRCTENIVADEVVEHTACIGQIELHFVDNIAGLEREGRSLAGPYIVLPGKGDPFVGSVADDVYLVSGFQFLVAFDCGLYAYRAVFIGGEGVVDSHEIVFTVFGAVAFDMAIPYTAIFRVFYVFVLIEIYVGYITFVAGALVEFYLVNIGEVHVRIVAQRHIVAVPFAHLYGFGFPYILAAAYGGEAEAAFVGREEVNVHHVAVAQVEMLSEFPSKVVEIGYFHGFLAIDIHSEYLGGLSPAADAESGGFGVGIAVYGSNQRGVVLGFGY